MSLLNGGKASWSILNTSGENQCFHVSSYFTSFTKPLLLHYGYYAARLILTLRSVIEKARAKPVGVQRHFSSSSPSRKKKQEDNVVGFPTTKSSGILAGTTILVLFLSRVMSNSSSSAFFLFSALHYCSVRSRFGPQPCSFTGLHVVQMPDVLPAKVAVAVAALRIVQLIQTAKEKEQSPTRVTYMSEYKQAK